MLSAASDQAEVLELLVAGLLAGADGVLARVWLTGRGDLCGECAMRGECADQTLCLHLAKSAGATGRIDGPFRRFPIGAREVGRVPETLQTFLANDGLESMGLADRAWLMAHDVRAFIAAPIVAGGHCAGVVAVFARTALDPVRARAVEAMAAIAGRALAAPPAARARPAPQDRYASRSADGLDLLRAWEDIEHDILERVLDHTGRRVSGPQGAAAILDLKPTTLQSRMKKLGIRRKRG